MPGASSLAHGSGAISQLLTTPEPDPQITPGSTTHFQHSPLQATQIRLLSFTQAWLDRDLEARSHTAPSLQCDIFDRATAPAYTALSYEWGDSSDHRTIALNGQPFSVRSNLWDALTYLPHHVTGYLWVDAMCIDQINTTERNHQVKAMGEIYGQARVVAAWLGLYDASIRACISPAASDSLDTVLESCKTLLARGYWKRLWIWQELVLAENTVMICGAFSISIERFRRHIQYNFSDWPPVAYTIYNTLNGGATLTLWEALLNFGSCSCSEPRDKVFALLGVLCAEERAAHHLTKFPNYDLGVDAIVLAALTHIRRTTPHGQYLLCRDAERILCALGALPGAATSKLSRALRLFEADLRERGRGRLVEHASRARKPTARSSGRRAARRRSALLNPPESHAVREIVADRGIREALFDVIPGIKLSMLAVLDCVFGLKRQPSRGTSRAHDGLRDGLLDCWASDYPGLALIDGSGSRAPPPLRLLRGARSDPGLDPSHRLFIGAPTPFLKDVLR